ncbi:MULTISPECIES: hypothetical protein [unclassified Pseudomonas]|nr:hypothetical protein [Pseudomonas sp. Pc102]
MTLDISLTDAVVDLLETRADVAICGGQGGHLPTRVRVLLDFLAERMRLP